MWVFSANSGQAVPAERWEENCSRSNIGDIKNSKAIGNLQDKHRQSKRQIRVVSINTKLESTHSNE